MNISKACDVALLTFSLNMGSCNGGSSARRRQQYEQKLELLINRKSTSGYIGKIIDLTFIIKDKEEKAFDLTMSVKYFQLTFSTSTTST